MKTVLVITALLLAGAPEPKLQSDPDKPWAIGPWKLACTRDGWFRGAHVEVCSGAYKVGAATLRFSRTPSWLRVKVDAEGCEPYTWLKSPAKAFALDAPDRVQTFGKALSVTLGKAAQECRVQPKSFAAGLEERHLKALLDASEGLTEDDGSDRD